MKLSELSLNQFVELMRLAEECCRIAPQYEQPDLMEVVVGMAAEYEYCLSIMRKHLAWCKKSHPENVLPETIETGQAEYLEYITSLEDLG